MKTTAIAMVSLAFLPGCLGLLMKPTAPSAQGANPVNGGAPLVASAMPFDYPGYTCSPGRVETKYRLALEGDQLCVSFTGGMMRDVGTGPPTLDAPMTASLRVDGKTSPSFELKPTARPSIGGECTANGQTPMRDWAIDAKGCVANNGLLTAQSTGVDALSDSGRTYASFKFGPASGANASAATKPAAE